MALLKNFTVRLQDSLGRVVLDPVSAVSASAAATAAVAAPPVSGDGQSGYTAGTTVDQAAVLAVSGTLADGSTPFPAATSLPVVPETVAPSIEF